MHIKLSCGCGRLKLSGNSLMKMVLAAALMTTVALGADAGLLKKIKQAVNIKQAVKAAAKATVLVATAPVSIPIQEAKQATKVAASVTKPLGPIGKVADTMAAIAVQADGKTTMTVTKLEKGTETAIDQPSSELHRAVVNVGEAFKAMEEYSIATAEVQPKAIILASRKIREHQFVDAVWQLAYSPLQQTEANAARLTAESALVNDVAGVAASAYGGPSGAAAYTAWHTYHATKNIELSIRAGLLTGASNFAISQVGVVYESAEAKDAALQVAQKAIAVAAIGGATVAAAGGSSRQVLDGFMRAGAMVLIQDGYHTFTNGDLVEDDKLATKAPICISAEPGTQACAPPSDAIMKNADGTDLITDGKRTLNVKFIDHTRTVVGLASDPSPPNGLLDKSVYNLTADNGLTMKAIAFTTPGANAFSLFHDQWVAVSHLEGLQVQGTIVPAIVLIYNGTAAPLNNAIEAAVISSEEKLSAQEKQERDQSKEKIAKILAPFAQPMPDDRDPTRQTISYACQTDQKQRFISVHIPDQLPMVQCAVLDTNDGNPYVPWYANNDEKFCRVKAEQMVHDLTSAGWVCVARDDENRTQVVAQIK